MNNSKQQPLMPGRLKFSRPKANLVNILVLSAFILAFLPFWNSIQDILTRLIMNLGWYKQIQNLVVPYELRIIVLSAQAIGLPFKIGKDYIEWSGRGGNQALHLVWNCVGWQSMVLFGVTLITGMSKNYTFVSKLEGIALGLLGTYIINILRLLVVVIMYYYFGKTIGTVFHDYFSSILSLSWLFFFWWFCYSFVLEKKQIN